MKVYWDKQGLTKDKKEVASRHLKARTLDLYYRSSYKKYYYFYKKCEEYFNIARAKSPKWVAFITSFVKDQILY